MIFQNIVLKDDLGISKIIKISLPNFNNMDFRSIESIEKGLVGVALLSCPHELGHFWPFFIIQSEGIELTKTPLFILKVYGVATI